MFSAPRGMIARRSFGISRSGRRSLTGVANKYPLGGNRLSRRFHAVPFKKISDLRDFALGSLTRQHRVCFRVRVLAGNDQLEFGEVSWKGASSQFSLSSRAPQCALRCYLLGAGYANNVERTEHDGFIPIRNRHHYRVLDDGRILRVIDEKHIPAAAPDLERLKRRLPKIHSNLLKHGGHDTSR